MYIKSEEYCRKSGFNTELLLQITVDNFNRHYIYRHDLTLDIVQNTYNHLLKIKQTFFNESMLLEYHLLLLEYLKFTINDKPLSTSVLLEFRTKIVNTRKKCFSSFYILKLYILEIYILIGNKHFEDASIILDQAFELVYKKEMRSYIYKLTYIKAYMLEIQNNLAIDFELSPYIFLAFEQILKQYKDTPNDLMRDIFLVVRLVYSIEERHLSCIKILPPSLCEENRNLMQEICKHIKGEYVKKKELFDMTSYFVFNNISFPNI